jgi:hypothetical protein
MSKTDIKDAGPKWESSAPLHHSPRSIGYRGADRVPLRLRGGATHTLTVPIPLPAGLARKTPPEVLALIDQLLDTHTELQVATILNERGFRGDREILFTGRRVARIRNVYKLKSCRRRLLDQGFAPLNVLRCRLQVSQSTIRNWWLQ